MTASALRAALAAKPRLDVMSAHNPLTAKLVAEAGFDAVWASGFEISASLALPDVSAVSMTQHLDLSRGMAEAAGIPIVADVDTGYGNAVNVDHVARHYEAAGSAAIVIEDKSFPKMTSLLPGGRQELVRIEEFQGKIAAACAARQGDMLVIARTEALIAGLGQEEGLRRAAAYAEAGADLILVHSKSRTPDEILAFAAAWTGDAKLVIVPTAYPAIGPAELDAAPNIRMVIYGNHCIRAAVGAIQKAFAQIRAAGSAAPVEAGIAAVGEIFRLQGMDRVAALEAAYLR